MTGIEQATQLFHDAGLAFPVIPTELAAQLKELRPWLFSTRRNETSPYDLGDYVRRVQRTNVKDYVILCHDGHGVNSYAIHYYLVRGSLRLFLQLGWGGVHMDEKEDAAHIRDCFSMADRLVAASQKTGMFQAGERMLVVASDFGGSYFLPPGKTRRDLKAPKPRKAKDGTKDRPVAPERHRSVGSKEVLTEALGWLISRQEG